MLPTWQPARQPLPKQVLFLLQQLSLFLLACTTMLFMATMGTPGLKGRAHIICTARCVYIVCLCKKPDTAIAMCCIPEQPRIWRLLPAVGIWRTRTRATGKVHIALRGVYGAYAAIHDLNSGALVGTETIYCH
jgi:hypothetical protein